jgi:hypothetical protein
VLQSPLSNKGCLLAGIDRDHSSHAGRPLAVCLAKHHGIPRNPRVTLVLVLR